MTPARRNPSKPSRMLYATRLVGVGQFYSLPSEPAFRRSSVCAAHLMVFPVEPVTIIHAGKAPVVADATRVMFYNDAQVYRREAISTRGDRCIWLALPGDAVAAAGGHDDTTRPFGELTGGPSDPRSALLAHALHEHIVREDVPDRLLVEEVSLTLLDRIVGRAWAAPPAPPSTARQRSHRELAQAARALLGTRFHEPLSLAEVAAALATSPFHLARVFSRQTGRSLHAWRNELRLAAAAARILDGAGDLTEVALEVGYASHSHFTNRFRDAHGVAPSALRQQPRALVRRILGQVRARTSA